MTIKRLFQTLYGILFALVLVLAMIAVLLFINPAVRAVLEPNTQGFLDSSAGGPAIEDLSVQDARHSASVSQLGTVVKQSADIEDRKILGGSNKEIAIRIVRPKDSKEPLPTIMYFHGGGWVLNDMESFDRLIREIANGTGAAVVFVEYSRSPEARYPVAIEEAYAATCWIVENGQSISLDPSRLAVVGDSSGGNMAAVITLLAKQRGGPKIDFQVLFCPTMDASFDTPSYQEFGKGYFLTRDAMIWFWNRYAPDVAVCQRVTAAPLKASVEQLRELLTALVITAECDPLRDEGEAYARKLMLAGVRVTATRYLGTIHGFVFLNALAETPAAPAAIEQANSALKEMFANGKEEPSRSCRCR
jgi:acetyl esterase